MSLSMFLKSIRITACIRISFFVGLNNIPLYVHKTFCLSLIHPLMDMWVVCTFGLLWILLLQTKVDKYLLRDSTFSSLGYIPRSGIDEAYGNLFNFFRTYHIAFYRTCIILHSHQQCTRVPTWRSWNSYVLPSISLCLLVIWISSYTERPFKYSAYFF